MGRLAAPRPFLTRLRYALGRHALRSTSAVTAAALAAGLPAAEVRAQRATPDGPEFRVNAYTFGRQEEPAVAMNADGDYVVVWESYAQDGYGGGIFGQRYNEAGEPQGAEFQVNTYTSNRQHEPAVAMSDDGAFVVVWTDDIYHDGTSFSIYDILARRYAPDGTPLGGEFRVNTYTPSKQYHPAVGMDADGDFVVVWEDEFKDGYYSGIIGRRYNAAGVPLTGEFVVNQYTTDEQWEPAVAMDAVGNFVAVWSGAGPSSTGIYGRRFGAATASPQFTVSTSTSGLPSAPAVALNDVGDAVVTWLQLGQGNGNEGVYARRYLPDGQPAAARFHVNTYTESDAGHPTVGIDAAGSFLIAWDIGLHDGSATGVYAQRYTPTGTTEGPEFRVNTTVAAQQRHPVIGMDNAGEFVVVWQSENQDGSQDGVFAQRYYNWLTGAAPAPASGLALDAVPNPATGAGLVRYELPEAGHVRVALYDVLGREVAVLADAEQAAGRHEAALDASALAPGAYLVRLTAGETALVRRVTIAR